jgi:4-methylaminobutanoate oxidase (formaldehyde-forming)
MARHVYLALHEAGNDLGLRDAGYYALDALRIEAGRRAWGAELGPDETPFEAGLGFAVKLDKGDFIGRETLERSEPRQKLACIVLDDPRAVALGSEPVRHGDEIVGRVTSGGYGYAVGASIAYAYVPVAQADPGTAVAIDIFGEWVGGEVRPDPLYDPKGERIRA